MKQITIPKGETGVLRVFAVSRPIPDMARAIKNGYKTALAGELLGRPVAADKIELFALSDLTGVGLPGYLIDGQGVAEVQIAKDRARLEGLDGYVLLLLSDAFDGHEVTLPATRDLTLIGSYQEETATRTAPPIDSAASKPYSGAPTLTPAEVPKGGAGSVMIVLAVVVIVALFLVWWLRT